MSDALSQQEVDSLLSSLTPYDSQYSNQSGSERNKSRSKIKIYDFKRPDKFSKDQIRTLRTIHETFARLSSTALSAQLRILANVNVLTVAQLTYEEFIRSIPSPTTITIISMPPLKGNVILEVDPNITYSLLDRLFGGVGDGKTMDRELTDIEIAVIESFNLKFLTALREAWSNVVDLRPKLENIETNPQFAQIIPPNDMVVLITFETKIGSVEGILDFCIPYLTIEPIINKLSAQYWYSGIRKGITQDNFENLKGNILKMRVDVVAELGRVNLKISDVINLKKFDIIKLPQNKITGLLTLKVGNVEKFLCNFGVIGKNLAVQVVDIIGDNSIEVFEELLKKQENYHQF